MPSSSPQPTREARRHEREAAKDRVVRAFRKGRNYQEVAVNNEVNNWTTRRCILRAESTGDAVSADGVCDSCVKMSMEEVAVNNEVNNWTARRCILRAESTVDAVSADGVRDSRVKMSMEVMSKIEEYMDEDYRHTCQQMADRLCNDLGLRIEKVTTNNTTNKAKRKGFVEALNKHGELALVSELLLPFHHLKALIRMSKVGADEYHELNSSNKMVVVTDNAPGHNQMKLLVQDMLVADGIVNGFKLVLLRLAPYNPMLNPIAGCWNVLKTRMKRFVAELKEELLVRGEYDIFTAHRMAIMKEAVESPKPAITRREWSGASFVPATLANTGRIWS
ncbi:Transposase [Phytophthora megakarya]|uniref:Transposase n=1 Tax=Phytophthora megakarya TaxID=4795 RepID=A0A225W9Q7_9STRA|nr:Transposase [Phytophthora megakarya]